MRQNQTKDLLVNNVTSASATAVGHDIIVLDSSGTKGASAAGSIAAGDTLMFKQLLADGNYRPSVKIKKEQVKYISKTLSVSETPRTAEFTMATSAVGDLTQAIVAIDEWGSKSYEDQIFVPGEVTQVAGDTAASMALRMVVSLTANFKNYEPKTGKKIYVPTGGFTAVYDTDADRPSSTSAAATNYYYVISTGLVYEGDGSTDIDALAATTVSSDDGTSVWTNPLFNIVHDTSGVVYLAEKAQRFVRGHIPYETVNFRVTAKRFDVSSEYDETIITVTHTNRVSNPLRAERLAQLEYNAMGDYGDLYDKAGWPQNLNREYLVDEAGTYTVSYQIQYATGGEGQSKGIESNATLYIACKSAYGTSNSNANLIEAALGTAFGIASELAAIDGTPSSGVIKIND